MQTALITSHSATLGAVGVTMVNAVAAIAAIGGRPSWGHPKRPR